LLSHRHRPHAAAAADNRAAQNCTQRLAFAKVVWADRLNSKWETRREQ
jgi:hypothetical protein